MVISGLSLWLFWVFLAVGLLACSAMAAGCFLGIGHEVKLEQAWTIGPLRLLVGLVAGLFFCVGVAACIYFFCITIKN